MNKPSATEPKDWQICYEQNLIHLDKAMALIDKQADQIVKLKKKIELYESVMGKDPLADVSAETYCKIVTSLKERIERLKVFAISVEKAKDKEIKRLKQLLDESFRLQVHYAELLNMHDGGERIVFENVEQFEERLKALAAQPQKGQDND